MGWRNRLFSFRHVEFVATESYPVKDAENIPVKFKSKMRTRGIDLAFLGERERSFSPLLRVILMGKVAFTVQCLSDSVYYLYNCWVLSHSYRSSLLCLNEQIQLTSSLLLYLSILNSQLFVIIYKDLCLLY